MVKIMFSPPYSCIRLFSSIRTRLMLSFFGGHKNLYPAKAGQILMWVMKESNLRPSSYQDDALPLSQLPMTSI